MCRSGFMTAVPRLFISLRCRWLLLAALAFAWPAAAGTQLDGPEEIVELLSPHLPAGEAGRGRLRELLGEILATEGWFSPAFVFRRDGETLHLTIDPGPRTRIAAVDIAVDGPLDDKTRAELVAGWTLPVGRPFRQADWNDAKQALLLRLLAGEHADARLDDSLADIDAEAARASLRLRYATGPRYRFGELRVEGLQRHPPELVERYNRVVRPGRPYSEAALADLQRALQATPYFASVETELDRAAATTDADGTARAPVIVRVRERPAHRVAFGAGVSSNTGARVEARYHTPDLFGRDWSFDGGLRYEQKRQTLYADVFLPPDGRDRRHSVGAVLEASDIQGLRTERRAFGARTVQQRGRVEQRLSLHWEVEDRTPDGGATVTSRALVPNAMWTWRQLDSVLNPRSGTVLQGQVGGGSRAVLSDQDFVRLHARIQHYLPLGRRDTLALRGEFGATLADSRDHIPQDYLFRTGGAGSVRGYGYQSLGVHEAGATLGGRYLAVLSAEATHWLDEAWGIAAFVDAGNAYDAPAQARLALGYGLGARWQSPAGPLGVDLAYGQRTGEIQLHFSLAIPF